MRAKYIIEAANHPTDPDADEVYYYLSCLLFKLQHELLLSTTYFVELFWCRYCQRREWLFFPTYMQMLAVWLWATSNGFRYLPKLSIQIEFYQKIHNSFFSLLKNIFRISKDSSGRKKRLTWSCRSTWMMLLRTSNRCAKLMTAASGWEHLLSGLTGLRKRLLFEDGKHKTLQFCCSLYFYFLRQNRKRSIVKNIWLFSFIRLSFGLIVWTLICWTSATNNVTHDFLSIQTLLFVFIFQFSSLTFMGCWSWF